MPPLLIAAEATPLISSLRLASSEVRGAAEALLDGATGVRGAGCPSSKGADAFLDGFNGCVNAEDVCAGLSISKRKKMCRRKKGKGLLTCFALCSPTCQSATEATNVFEWGPGAELSWD